MLQLPGVPEGDATPESLTPPLLSKQVSSEAEDTTTPLVERPEDAVFLSPEVDDEGYNGDGDPEDDDSDSDEGLTIMSRKPKIAPIESSTLDKKLERRGTNASVGSTETAKKVVMDS